tara:strand:- start:224 stop:430 length:207 start_codon:yes stop_codon:yes gene_type:complete
MGVCWGRPILLLPTKGYTAVMGSGPKVKEFGSRPRGFESARRQYEKFQTKEIKTLRKIADKIEQEIKH